MRRAFETPHALFSAMLLAGTLGCASAPELPDQPVRVTAAREATWRESPPVVPPPAPLVAPELAAFDLANGMPLIVGRSTRMPVVCLALVFAAGSASDPPGKAGLAAWTLRSLLEGAAYYDAFALDVAFARLGATPQLEVEADGATLSITVLRHRAADALQLLAQIARRPHLTDAGLQRQKAEQLATLARRSSEPDYLARQAFLRVSYGPEHPYAHPSLGFPETVEALEPADARAFYTARVGPSTTAIVVSGDVTVAQAQRWASGTFGDWSAPAVRLPAPPPVAPETRTWIHAVPRAGSTQTTLLLGRPVLPAGHPDEAALEIATAAIGGMFSSRLNLALRERRGYTYGVQARLDPRRGDGPWVAHAAVRGDVTAAALNVAVGELQEIPLVWLTEAETDAARSSLMASLPALFESAQALAAAAAHIYMLQQPIDRYAKLLEELREATAGKVEEVAIRYLRPSQMTIVAVGDPAVLATQLPRAELEPTRAVSTWAAAR